MRNKDRMEMPKDCLKCQFCLFADGYWKCLVDGSHADFGGTCRPSLCPLVPVPDHGDLIDRDELVKKCEWANVDDDTDVRAIRYDVACNAPAVIPASRESE